MDIKRGLIVVSVYLGVSVLIFVSDFVPLGMVEDVSVSPAIFSLILLVPLFLWYMRIRRMLSSEDEAEENVVWVEIFALFLLAMAVRIPFVLVMGMAFEKTAVIYLVVLTVALVKRNNLGVLGFRTEHFTRSLLIGLAYYLVFGIALFATFFGLIYAFTGHLVVSGYDLFPSLFVFPFMTFCVGVSEEGLFRGFIQTRLAKFYSERKALLVQALLFGVWHFIWHVSPFDSIGMLLHVSSTFVFGLVFGQFYRKSRNLIPLILAHGLVDTIGYGATFNPELEMTDPLVQGIQALSFITGIIILALCTKFLAGKAQVNAKTHVRPQL